MTAAPFQPTMDFMAVSLDRSARPQSAWQWATSALPDDPPEGDAASWLACMRHAYKSTRRPVQWPVPEALRASPAVTLRDHFALQLAARPAENIAERYVYMFPRQMAELVRLVERRYLPHPLRGRGIELGAGCGVLAAVAAAGPEVEAVIALEVCEQVTARLVPVLAAHVLGDDADKVIPVVGSFDDLRIPDSSLDFAIENDSLHHSDDLTVTIGECARVLKPGGYLLCFDRCHDNSVTDADVDRLLSKVYGPEFLVAHGYPPEMRLTRRDNGEHEYREFEWRRAGEHAGLVLDVVQPVVGRITLKKAVKGLCSRLPWSLRRRLYQTDNATPEHTAAWIRQCWRGFRPGHRSQDVLAPKSTTILVFRKPL